jgi:putative ABC transport system substrate-binding protein
MSAIDSRAALRVALVFGLLVTVPPAAGAQQRGKPYRIGMLEGEGQASNVANLGAFRQGLIELGHVEGQSFVIEYRSADGRPERFPELAAELVRLKVDAIVTKGDQAALAVKQASATIPIVMATSGDPAVSRIVATPARPSGNVTGFHVMAPAELGGKRLQLLREAVPGVSRVGILWSPGDIYSPPLVRDTGRVAREMGVQLKSLEVPKPEGFAQAFEAAILGQVEALVVVEDLLMITDRARIVDFTAMSRLPAIYGLREFVDAGGFMSYGTDRRDLFRRSAGYVHRILNGARLADLPVAPPTRFELAINLRTANVLGLTIPPALLLRADHVVR